MTTPPHRTPFWCDPHPADTDLVPRDGRRHLGVLDDRGVVRRQWNPADGLPHPQVIHSIDRLAALPGPIAYQVADSLTGGLWVGPGNVPDLDHMTHLAGSPVRAGSASLWDNVPGATDWAERVVVLGTGPHVSASLPDHEIGHVLERRRQAADTQEWGLVMFRCGPLLTIERWQDPREWWAESFALVITKQFEWLVRSLSGSTAVAEIVVRYYVRHYGLEV